MSVDLSDPNVQAAIQKLVDDQLKAAGVEAPVPPKVLTPVEELEAAVEAVSATITGDAGRVFDTLVAVLGALQKVVAVVKGS